MFNYTYQDLYYLVKEYNKKHKTNININELLDVDFGSIKKQGFLDKSMFGKYEPKVVYEDDDFFGIYKPPFWIINVGGDPRASDVHKHMNEPLLQVWLYKNLDYQLKNNNRLGYGICNRLDINTSGIVIVAKNEKNYHYMRKEISSHLNTRKKYFALVSGKIENQGVIQTDIECVQTKGSSKCYNTPYGQKSKTEFFPIVELKDDDNNIYTLLDIRIFTGRTHQIRVHLKMLNTYIIGDNMYSTSPDDYLKHIKLVPRIFLHAYYYSFLNLKGDRINIFAPLTDDLIDALKNKFTVVDKEITKEQLITALENPESLLSNKNKS